MIGLARIKCSAATPSTPHAFPVLILLSALKISTRLNTIAESLIERNSRYTDSFDLELSTMLSNFL